MLTPISITLAINAISITLLVVIMVVLIWYGLRRSENAIFALFLLAGTVWSAGSLISRVGVAAELDEGYILVGLHMLAAGFVTSSLLLTLYVLVVTGHDSLMWRRLIGGAAFIIALVHIVAYLSRGDPVYGLSESGLLEYRFDALDSAAFFGADFVTMVLIWRNFRKIQGVSLAFGVMLFCFAQLLALVSGEMRTLAVAEDAGFVAMVVMGGSLLHSQIIHPLVDQSRQIEIVRDIGLAITSRLRLQNVLRSIAAQAAVLLDADASIIMLRKERENMFILAAQYNIDEDLLGQQLRAEDGLAGRVAAERRSTVLADYGREWNGVPDTSFAERGFGAVIGVPLIFADEVVGVLLVSNKPGGRLFESENVRLLELLAPQAALAITNSRLFEQERELTGELATAKTQLETVLASTDNAVIALDEELRIVFANKAAAALVPGETSDLRGRPLFDLVPKDYLTPKPRQLVLDLRNNKSHVYELLIEERTYLCHLTRMRKPEKGWVAVLNDVSSLKELERLQRQMMEFTTHQLKNPLQGAMFHLDELEDLGEGTFTPEMSNDIAIIRDQMDRMNNLIRGILNLERLLNSDDLGIDGETDLAQIVQSVARDSKPLAQSKSIEFTLNLGDDIPPVLGEPQQLKEAVTCLVDNAIKYTPSGGTIEVALYYEKGQVRLDVADTGIGIPEEALARVFDRFYRVEQSGTEQIGGSGLGLNLAKTIIERHHGTIKLESIHDKGATFRVTLPARVGEGSKAVE